MRLKLKHITLSLSMLALAACKESVGVLDPVEPTIPDSEKTPIELSVGGVDGAMQNVATRASVITDEVNTQTFSNFDAASKLFMVMKSEWVTLPSGYTDINYGGSQDTKYCVTRGEVAANQDKVVFNTGLERYWDDAHARSSKISIWAYTAPGATYETCKFGTADGIQGWKTTAISPVINTWKVYKSGTEQTSSDLISQNLCFSNNIVDYTSESGTDRRLYFKTPDKKFQGGKLVFYHAMSKITIHIKKGDGYAPTDPFAFNTNTTIVLDNYNVSGTFNIADGKFSSTTDGQISKISEISKADGDAYTLQALVIPGTTHSTNNGSIWKKGNTNTSMSFVINDNLYKISQDALITALCNNSTNNRVPADATTVEMEAGKNYIFTFVIGKKKIEDITAQVVEWENVTAEELAPSNARIKLNLEERGTGLTSSDRFSLYRAADDNQDINDDHTSYNWKTGYSSNVTPDFVSEANGVPAHWTTNWYWDNNKNFYHFRVLCEAHGSGSKTEVSSIETDATNGDYLALTSAVDYKDILWGAPMLDVENGNNVSDANATPKPLLWLYGPTKNGFDADDDGKVSAGLPTETQHQIYKAIGPTEDQIKLILFHMMSDVTFNIITTSNSDKVELFHQYVENGETKYKRTRLDLVGFYNGGKVLLGSGLVMTARDGNFSTIDAPVNIPFGSAADNGAYTKQVYTFGAVPQNLAKETTGSVIEKSEDVKLYITTPDNNQYIVDLKDVVTSSITTSNIANPYTKIAAGQPNAGKYKLDRWYPGFKYNYTFKLTKKGIVDIQATIVNWETVTADDQPVTIR